LGVCSQLHSFEIRAFCSYGWSLVFTDKDGWTVRTGDHALSAHFEHTLVVTSGVPILLTAGYDSGG
jgi:methionyl aminopeptidase